MLPPVNYWDAVMGMVQLPICLAFGIGPSGRWYNTLKLA